MKAMPGQEIFVYTRRGWTSAISHDMDSETFSSPPETQNFTTGLAWRPFSNAIELRDENNCLLTQSEHG